VGNGHRVNAEEDEIQRHPVAHRDIDHIVIICIRTTDDARLADDPAWIQPKVLACHRRPDGIVGRGGAAKNRSHTCALGDRMLHAGIGEEHRSYLGRADQDGEEDGRSERELHRGGAACFPEDKSAAHYWILNAASAVIGTAPLAFAAELSAIGP
jgi:hypothetical protein